MLESLVSSPILWALTGGVLPSFIWLWFWLKEDEAPEPKRLIVTAFIGGMLAVPFAFILEKELLGNILATARDAVDQTYGTALAFLVIALAAFIEEGAKFIAVLALIFWRKEYDEPADAMIYLITAALGFAALENVLYLEQSFAQEFGEGFIIANLRFIGATLLHALSSAALGYSIGSAFFKRRLTKELHIIAGLILATLLHTMFNAIILLSGRGEGILVEPALIFLAGTGIVILFSFERIKHKIIEYHAKRQ